MSYENKRTGDLPLDGSAPRSDQDPNPIGELERFILTRAERMNLNPEDPQIRQSLELEYLSTYVPKLIREGNFSTARAPAERYYALAKEHPIAIACVATVRFKTAMASEPRAEAYKLLSEVSEKNADELEVHLMLADVALSCGEIGLVRTALARAQAIADGDPRVRSFKERLREARATLAPPGREPSSQDARTSEHRRPARFIFGRSGSSLSDGRAS